MITQPEYSPVILVRQYYWPLLLPPTAILQPAQNLNINLNCYPNNNIQDPNNNFQYPPVIAIPNPSMAPFIPCVMRQVPIHAQYVDYNQNNYPQVIESHNYCVPANYFGGMVNQINQWT